MRFRYIAALFALIALTATTVQGLWASTCEMQMETPTAAAEACLHGAGAVGDPQADASQDEPSSDAPHCPFTPMNAGSSCGAVVALPSDSDLSLESSSPEALPLMWPNDARDLLLAAVFFHPPIA